MKGHSLHRGAFTLLEMLAATTMMAMLAGSLYASLYIAFKARSSAVAATLTVRKTDIAVDMIRADLRSAVVPNGMLAGPFVGRSMGGAPGFLSDDLTFCASVPDVAPGVGVGDIKLVQYACELSSDNSGMVLVRRLTANLLAVQTPQFTREVVARGVAAFKMTYFDGQTWQESWDSTTLNNTLPKAVGVDIEFEDAHGGPGAKISRVILPACGIDTSASTTSSSGASP